MGGYHDAQYNPLYILREGISNLEQLRLQSFVVQTISVDHDFFLQGLNMEVNMSSKQKHDLLGKSNNLQYTKTPQADIILASSPCAFVCIHEL